MRLGLRKIYQATRAASELPTLTSMTATTQTIPTAVVAATPSTPPSRQHQALVHRPDTSQQPPIPLPRLGIQALGAQATSRDANIQVYSSIRDEVSQIYRSERLLSRKKNSTSIYEGKIGEKLLFCHFSILKMNFLHTQGTNTTRV